MLKGANSRNRPAAGPRRVTPMVASIPSDPRVNTNAATDVIQTFNLTNFTATNSLFSFTDRSATNYRVRFYRIVSP